MRVGDVVRLRADEDGAEAMVVVEVRQLCDGTSGDGAALLCAWFEDEAELREAWLSESAVALVRAARPPTSQISTPRGLRRYDRF